MNEPTPEKKKLPFHNLFLNAGAVHGQNQWWMYFAGVGAVILGYLTFQLFALFIFAMAAQNHGISAQEIQNNPNILLSPESFGMDKNLYLALICGMFVFALFGLYRVVTRVHHKPFLSIITAYDKFRYSRFWFAFAVWGILITISSVGAYFYDPTGIAVQFHPFKFFMLVLVSVIFLPIQSGLEEVVFRGYLLQGISLVTKNGLVTVIITALLFGLMHMSNPEVKEHGWAIMLPYYSVFGLFLGVLALLDEGLELALGIHCANNIISSMLVTTPNGVLQTDAVFVSPSENPVAELLLWLVLSSITFIIFWLKYRWKNFNLILK